MHLRSRHRIRLGLAAIASLAVLALAPGVARATGGAIVQGQALVLLKRPDAAVGTSAQALIARHSLQRVRPDVPEIGLVTVRVPRGAAFKPFTAELRRDSAVAAVEPDYRYRLRYVPNDPAMTELDSSGPAGATYQWYLGREGFPAAWDGARGTGVKVGIVDTGLDGTHPEFAGKVAFAASRIAGSANAQDTVGHGTHVAGLSCAATDNGVGIAGAGFDCQLVIEKTDLSSASVVASIVDAVDRGAKVINMSFGGGRQADTERRVIRYAIRKDVVLVAAAADSPTVNQGHPAKDLQPAGTARNLDIGSGLVVTAAGPDDTRAPFAGRGSQISMAAYGYTGSSSAPGIFSTFPAGTTSIETGSPGKPCTNCRTTFHGDNRYAYLAGTSMAAPQVAGAVALVRSANPKLSNFEVIRLMKLTARRSGGWNTELGWGILDAGAAVRAARALAADTVPPTTTPRGGHVKHTGATFALSWRGRDSAGLGVSPAGVESYNVYVKRGSGWSLAATTDRTTVSLTGSRGRSYSFFVQARDWAGNVEPAPRGADFVVRVRRR